MLKKNTRRKKIKVNKKRKNNHHNSSNNKITQHKINSPQKTSRRENKNHIRCINPDSLRMEKLILAKSCHI